MDYGPALKVAHTTSIHIPPESTKPYCQSTKKTEKYKLALGPKKGTVHFDAQLAVSDWSFTLNK